MNAELNAWLELRAQTLGRVRRVLIDRLKVQRAPEEIDPDAPLFGTGLALDSVDAVELVVSLETEFGVRLDDETLGRPAMRTMNSLVDLVLRKQGGKHLAPGSPAEAAPTPELSLELKAIRTTTALCESSPAVVLGLSGTHAFATLDKVCPAPLTLQDTQLKPSLLLDEQGVAFADVYVARDDQRYLLIAEGPDAAELEQHLRAHAAGPELTIERFDGSHRMFSVHGPWAWDLLAACLGPDVIGMPYLTLMRGGGGLTCFRTGKTGEYGYELLVPNAGYAGLRDGIVEAGRDWELQPVSQAALDHCALENWFFNIREEGRHGLGPLELGLQWRLSPKKKEYVGSAAVQAARQKGVSRRLACLVSADPMAEGDEVTFDGKGVGRVLQAVRSEVAQRFVASALVEVQLSVPGLWGFSVGGHPVRAVAPPVLNNRSLYVSPQRHTWADRDSPAFPPLTLPA